jgi:DNA polymerase-1
LATKKKSRPASAEAATPAPAHATLPAGSQPPVFLLDAMSFIFRAYHAMARQKGMSTRIGVPTGATYVFVNLLRKLRADFAPQYLAAVFDVAAPTFRDEQAAQLPTVGKWDAASQSFQQVAYGGYKANRAETPAELIEQLPYIRRALAAFRIPVLELAGFEADDLIGSLARQASEADHPVFVVSSDKDMLQLVNARVWVLNPPKDNLIANPAMVEQLIGVPPERVVDVMALRGDAIDNIPGAPGIGDKGSVELIRQFGSVEAALDGAASIARKAYRESLLNNRDAVLISKQMATIECHAPVTLDLAAMHLQPPDADAARELFTELEFTSLVKDFLPAMELGTTDYHEASSAEDVAAALRSLAAGRSLAVALPASAASMTTTEGDDDSTEEATPAEPASGQLTFDAAPPEPVAVRLESIAISAAPNTALVVPLGGPEGSPAEALRAALADPALPKALNDHKAALALFARIAPPIILAGVRDDPALYSYLLDPTYSSHTLPEIALRRFNLKLTGDLAEAADLTGRLAAALRAEVEERRLLRLYEEIDLPLVAVLARMEAAGVKLDGSVLAEMSRRLAGECSQKAAEIWQEAGEQFNINSPKQLARILFEKLALPKPFKRGKGRAISTAVDVLEGLAADHAVPRLVLEYRQLAKLKSTYVDALPALVNPATGRLHTTFDQTNTATGRLSSKNPNLQNIPIRTELGRQIRAAFIAEPGCLLLSADYSQIELRLLAHYSEDPRLLEAYQRGDDIHTQTASEVFGVAPLAVTPELRRRAKAINFGIPYGLSPFGLSQQLGIEPGEARAYIEAYFTRYAGVSAWLERTREHARQTQQVENLFGRVRPIPDINSTNANLRGFAERTAVNTPLQGTAADLIKLAMIRLDRELAARHLRARMILQVHDELLLEVPQEEMAAVQPLVRQAMEGAYRLRVPLLVEVGTGRNWRDLK